MVNLDSIIDKIEFKIINKSSSMHNPTLDADLGVLLFEAIFYEYSGDIIYKEKCLKLLNNFIDIFPQKELHFGFYEGFESVFWVINYLKECDIIEDMNIVTDILPYLYKSIEFDISANNFDLLHGSINKLQFLIKNFGVDDEETLRYINNFIDSLYSKRVENEHGIFWYDEPIGNESSGINLGYAHGIPSLLVFLVRLNNIGYQKKELIILIEGIIKSLNSFKFKVRSDSNYPDMHYNEENEHISSRLGFCYGDLGVAYALSYVGISLNKESLILEAKRITRDICRRVLSNSGIVHFEDYHFFDTSFCHGISGVLYILIKINNLLPSNFLKKRIDFWQKELIHNLEIQLNINEEITFPSYLQPNDSNPYSIDEEALLIGYTGTAMVLLSLQYEKYDWSDIFLLY